MMSPLLVILAVIQLGHAFDINDPKTNIDSLIRVIGSWDQNDIKILYGNGTIYGRQPFQEAKKMFFFEGFNIGRKQYTGSGYLSLTREVFIYRDLQTGHIVDIWTNTMTQDSNEVFQVHNDPVDLNFTYGEVLIPTVRFPEGVVAFTSDILLQYPNPLDPSHYGIFSSGPIYQTDELFQYFSDYDILATTNTSSVNMTGAWFRRGQYLPWMQMGQSPGHLYYMTTNWKCLNGFLDFSPQLLNFVWSHFPEFLQPPSVFNPVSQTTWGVIKKEIDRRRTHGLPDVIFPLLNISKNSQVLSNNLDERVRQIFANDEVKIFFNGSVYSEITGQPSKLLFEAVGNITTTFKGLSGEEYVLHIKGSGEYRDAISHELITSFLNPFTNRTVNVPKISLSSDFSIKKDNVFSMPVPNLDKISVQGLTSLTTVENGEEVWSVEMFNIFFKNSDFDRFPFFYGTLARFGSWYQWLDMGQIKGNLVQRLSISRRMNSVPNLTVGR